LVFTAQEINQHLESMRVLSLVSLMVLAATVFSLSAHAEPPAAPSATQLNPQIQAMLDDLLKTLETAGTQEGTPTPAEGAPKPAPSGPAAADGNAAAEAARIKPVQSALQTSGLRTGGLMSSGSLGGHGMAGAPRLTNAEWRQLFPARR
jgi:hypothetical protein